MFSKLSQSSAIKGFINKNYEIFLLTFTILLFIYRTAIPFFKYPFIILYFISIFYFLFTYFSKIKLSLNKFIKNFFWVFLISLILLLAFLFSNKIYLIIIKDLLNILIIISIFFFLNLSFKTKRDGIFFRNNLIYLSIFFALVISIADLFGINLLIDHSINQNIRIDYNFALIPVFFGLVGILFKLPKQDSFISVIISNLLLLIFSINILFSGSRRGLILLSLIIFMILIALTLNMFKVKNLLTNIGNKAKYLIILISIFVGIFYMFLFHTSIGFKNEVLRTLSSKNLYHSKILITRKIYKLSTITSKKTSYNEFYNNIWPKFLDPGNPDTWGETRVHKIKHPLLGKNIEMLPEGAKGYLMDSTCNANSWRGNAYSYTRIGNDSIKKGNVVYASVYCYVSKKYDGTWVRLSSEGATFGNKESIYDLNNKGSWQKLDLKVSCKKGKAPVYLYFSKYGVTDFSTLKGHIIFAYPQYKIIRKDSLQSYINPGKIKVPDKPSQNILIKQNLTKIQFDSPQMDSYKLKSPNNSAQSLTTFSKAGNTKYYQSNFFNFSVLKLVSTDTTQIDTDPIRNWIAKVVSEDTTYYPYKANIVVDSVSDNFIAPRTVRWQFAWQVFTKEYNWKQKIFGNGFDYLNWYGYYFLNDKKKSDYPHNPFLSVLLYSGITGLLIYIFFLYKVFFYYVKYIKEYYIIFIFFLITFYFSFFSGNSPLSSPLIGFFIMFPFLIHAVHKEQKE